MGESKIRKQQMEQRTQQIIHTALKLFCEKGIEDTSVSLRSRQELPTGR